jgi:hypothetical protein
LRYRIFLFGTVVQVLFAITSAWAHHGPSAIFEMRKRIAVTGTLTKIDWINPHINIAIDGKGAGGAIEHWTFESNPPSWFRSVGLSRSDFATAIGKAVTVEGWQARDGSLFGYMQKIALPDGRSLELVFTVDLN